MIDEISCQRVDQDVSNNISFALRTCWSVSFLFVIFSFFYSTRSSTRDHPATYQEGEILMFLFLYRNVRCYWQWNLYTLILTEWDGKKPGFTLPGKFLDFTTQIPGRKKPGNMEFCGSFLRTTGKSKLKTIRDKMAENLAIKTKTKNIAS